MHDTLNVKKKSGLPVPLRKVKTAITNPGAFFRYRSNAERSFYSAFSRFAHFKTRAARCDLPANSNNHISINDEDGYAVFTPDQVPDALAAAVVQEITEKLAHIDIEETLKSTHKPYLLNVITAKEFSRESAVYKLATHPKIVEGVARYLNCFPILTSISVLYSPNAAGQETGSQKYHLDHEDQRQIKGFMFIKDVGKKHGPFTLISARDSEDVQKKSNYKMTRDNKRVDDEMVYNIVDKDRAVSMTGDAGTMALIDASRCFHYGSREGTEPRIMLTFQYLTPFAYVMPWNWKRKRALSHFHDKDMSSYERKLFGLDV